MTWRSFVVVRRNGALSICDRATAAVLGPAGPDSLQAVVSALLACGCPHVKVVFNHLDVLRDGEVLRVDGGDDSSVPVADRRASPLVQRDEARRRTEERKARGGRSGR